MLFLFGHPSVYSNYLKGFHTKKPNKVSDHIFNIIFWLMISIAYIGYVKCSSKFGFFKTKLLYGSCTFLFFIIIFGFINPYLDEIGFYDWIGLE